MAGPSVAIDRVDDASLPATMSAILRLGRSDGLTKVNLGVDFRKNDGPDGRRGTHVDHDLAKIENNLVVPGYADVRTDVGAVRLTSYVGAATTPHSTHSRTEYRELDENGMDKASWSSRSGRHYVWCRGAIIRLAPGRPHMAIAQVHDADDDVATIRVEGSKVVSTFGDHGRPGTLATSLETGRIHEWMIETIRSEGSTVIRYYWDDMSTPKATQTYEGGSGNYFKFGNYHQSTTSDDERGDSFVLDLYDSEVWHTGYPAPAARHGASPGVTGGGPGGGPAGGVPVGTTQLFFEGFESGGFSRWTSAQTHKTVRPASSYDPGSSYSLRIADAGPDHPHVLRTEVRDGDTAVGDHERAELSAFDEDWAARNPGADELWYECDFRLGDPGWTAPDAWTIIMQWHQDHAEGSPPLALSVHSDNKVYFELEADDHVQEPIPVWTVRPGAWEHVVIHVKWSPKKDEGFVEAFVNGVRTVPRTFRQTMYKSDRRNYLKIGCYRRRSNTATAVVMHDNLRVSGPPASPSA